jgi:hypothetical protein
MPIRPPVSSCPFPVSGGRRTALSFRTLTLRTSSGRELVNTLRLFVSGRSSRSTGASHQRQQLHCGPLRRVASAGCSTAAGQSRARAVREKVARSSRSHTTSIVQAARLRGTGAEDIPRLAPRVADPASNATREENEPLTYRTAFREAVAPASVLRTGVPRPPHAVPRGDSTEPPRGNWYRTEQFRWLLAEQKWFYRAKSTSGPTDSKSS